MTESIPKVRYTHRNNSRSKGQKRARISMTAIDSAALCRVSPANDLGLHLVSCLSPFRYCFS